MEDGLSGKSMSMVDAIFQARMGSTRLPGKVIALIIGKPLISHIVERVRASKYVKRIILATTKSKDDDELADFAQRMGIMCFRGDDNDVLARFYGAATEFDSKFILRVCCDNPLTDPRIIDELAQKCLEENADYVSTSIERTFPLGMDLEVFTFGALRDAFQSAKLGYEREHVTPYIYQHPELFAIRFIEAQGKPRRPDLRLTVDSEEDLRFMKEIFKRLYNNGNIFSIEKVIDLLDEHPELLTINAHIHQKKLGE